MSSEKILVLDANAPAATVAVQSLGKRRLEVHGVGHRRPLAYGSRRLSRKLLYPEGWDEARLLDWIQELDESEAYSLVIPSTEVSLRIMQRLPDDHDLRRRAVMPARESVDIALDKIETCRLAQRLGIPVPESDVVDGRSDQRAFRAYPVVLKPSRSQVVCDGRLAYVVPRIARNDAERAAFLEQWQAYTDVQEQEYFPGRGVGIECLYDRGRLRWAFAHQRIHELPLTGGASSYRRSIPCPPELLDCAKRLLSELDWHGAAMVEFRVNAEGGFVLLEINPRLWGSLPLPVRSGVDFPLGLFLLATGEDLPPQPSYRLGHRMRNLERDVEWMWENWVADHGDPFLLTRPRIQSVFEWLLPLTGKEGWDLIHWSDPAPLFVQLTRVVKRVTGVVRSRLSARRRRRRLRLQHRRNLRRLVSEGSVSCLEHIEFICYGNICRSPFAERVARDLLPQVEVSSNGFHPSVGRSSPDGFQTLAREHDIDLSAHRSRSLSDDDPPRGDLLVVMDVENYEELVSRFPDVVDRVVFLGLFAPTPRIIVPDPYASSDDQVRRTHALICDSVHGFARWLADHGLRGVSTLKER